MNITRRCSGRHRRVTWVMSGCAYAREGMRVVTSRLPSPRQTVEMFTGQESPDVLSTVFRAAPPALIVVYLSGAADRECDILRGLAHILRQARVLPEVVVLCKGAVYWVYLALMRLSGRVEVADVLRTLAPGQDVTTLAHLLHDPVSIPLLRLQLTDYQRQAPLPLSPREMQTLQWTLEGVPMAEQGYRLGVSEKTLYAHRYNAMKKLGGDVRYRSGHWLWHMARLFCGAAPVPGEITSGDGQETHERRTSVWSQGQKGGTGG